MYGQTDDTIELNRIGYYWFYVPCSVTWQSDDVAPRLTNDCCRHGCFTSQKFWLTHNRNLLVRHSALTPIPPKATEFRAPLRERYSLGQGRSVCLVECASRSDRHVALFTRQQLNDREDVL